MALGARVSCAHVHLFPWELRAGHARSQDIFEAGKNL